jgi:type I restriction-modification system DNA methylase subunit/restriction endonuclease S subunit
MSANQHIKTFLEALGFKSKNGVQYSKEYKLQGYTISADINKGKIQYRKDDNTTVERVADGQIQLGDKTTSNFSQPENFVVLECVDRLLNKGYLPNDIHLERRYPSGRGASGGKSDVCVYGKDSKSLMVIECKTYGAEYEKERKKMEEHGGQLFAYLANDQNAKFLVLYASKINDENKFDYENLIVQIKDREEDLKKSTKQIEEENIKLYRDAKNKAELYEVWKESFNLYFHFNGIFDDDANAYSLELKALKKKNLKPLEDSQGLFNKFAEILRHNNISDNANAFNKILSLFLCKIVDEEKNDEDVLDFQVKEDEEYEHIIDRLQALYQKGMKKLNEEIVYYSEKELHEIIKLYPKQTPIESIEAVFRELKYYTNNEFAFKEVHNKKLFIQNGRVLTEVIKLLQNYKFKYTSKFQVLGEFFELMLNHGVKQSEGQFFTPIPIVRYIILSLGFEKIIADKIANDEDYLLPKILDYACGAGHFLTESIEELQTIIKKYNTTKLTKEQQEKFEIYKEGTKWTKDYIYGIEKDFRLARTSQIACYINGDGDANLIFGDGLEEHDQLKLEKKKFDIVVANPPYSVEAFKNYLNVGKTHFELYNALSERSSQIEVLFIERTKQVLADKGLAGIVLPSTILSNTGIYTKAREILLKHFEIKAITELGSKTFIATGTTTVILFLKRRNDNFLKDREYFVSDLFTHTKYAKDIRYVDIQKILKQFTEFRNFDFEEYQKFLAYEISDELAKTEMFTEYRNAFDNSTEIKNLVKKPSFKNLAEKEQEAELKNRFYYYCKDIEKQKCFYYMLCLGDGFFRRETIEEYYKPQQTVIVKTGGEINEQKEFLGYEFQGKKGQEGIKINQIGGKLYDETNYNNPERANSYIRAALTGKPIPKIHEALKNNVAVYNLIDLIDFDKVEFEKTIKTNANPKNILNFKYELKKLGDLCLIIAGQSPNSENFNNKENGLLFYQGKKDFGNKYLNNSGVWTTEITKESFKGDILMSVRAPVGDVNINPFEKICIGRGLAVIRNSNEITQKYIYEFIALNKDLFKGNQGVAFEAIPTSDLANIKIPVPPLEIQQQIVNEINEIETKETEGLAKVEALEKEILTEFEKAVLGKNKVKLDKIVTIQSGGTPKTGVPEYWDNGTINWLRSEICQNCYVYESDVKEKITEQGLAKSSAKLLKPNTVLMALVGATIGRVAYLTFEATTNQNVTGLYPKDETELIPKYLFYALMNDFDKNFGDRKGKFTMANLTMIKNLEISLPTYAEQKKLVDIIEAKEQEIETIKLTLANIKSEKEAVLTKHL